MTILCGIYRLNFKNTDKVYIGLSKDINKRYAQHIYSMKSGTSSKKLQSAYTDFGTPTLAIEELCCESTLETRELFYINKYNSKECGFNTILGSTYNVSESGYLYGKYDKSEYEVMFLAIYETRMQYGYSKTIKELATTLDVSYDVLRQIANCTNHRWLKEVYPEEYRYLEELVDNYTCGAHTTSKCKGITHPDIQDKYGTIYSIGDNLSEFCRKNNLDITNMSNMLKGRVLTHKGFRLLSTPLPKKWVLRNESLNSTITILEREVSKSIEGLGLSLPAIVDVINGKRLSHKGWCLV